MIIKCKPVHAYLLHQYFWDLDEIKDNMHDDYVKAEVVNVTEDVVTIEATSKDGDFGYLFVTDGDLWFQPLNDFDEEDE